MKEKNEEDELLDRIAREMMKSGDVKSAAYLVLGISKNGIKEV